MNVVHPLTVHLPIGLLIGSLLFTLLALRGGDQSYAQAGYHCLRAGWLALLPAVAAGLWDASRLVFGASAPHTDALGLVNAHAASGLALMVAYWQAWQIRRRMPAVLDDPQRRRGYLLWLAIGTALLLLSGWLGGQLVYAQGVGVAR